MVEYIFYNSTVLKPNQTIKILLGTHYLKCQMYKPEEKHFQFKFVCIMLCKVNF